MYYIGIIWHIIQRILYPRYWIQNDNTNYRYSKYLSDTLDKEDTTVKLVSDFTVKINGVEIWVKNYPYAYGYMENNRQRGIPTVQVRRKLKRRLARLESNPFK